MNRYKPKFYSLLLLIFLLFGMMNTTPLVTASEEEETDQFITMPNYRWQNESTSEAQEQLLGDNYEVYNLNNETSGTSDFAKSRQLNSRDFYFESRFGLDTGGNETEYFRDQLGDACDFTEGDTESLSMSYADSSVNNGLLTLTKSNSGVTYMYGTYTNVNDFSGLIYSKMKLRFMVKSGYSYVAISLRYVNNVGLKTYVFKVCNTPSEFDVWHDITIDLQGVSDWEDNGLITSFGYFIGVLTATDLPTVYIDDYKLIGDLDYATHTEGEIEDTWDWEDSLEYFYNEENNISDFNDGTTEDWVANSTEGVSEADHWLSIVGGGVSVLACKRNDLSIDSSVYKWFTMEYTFTSTTGAHLVGVVIYDADNNVVGYDSTDHNEDEYVLFSDNLDDYPDWSGTETELVVRFSFNETSLYFLQVNFTFLYDSELGDLEDFTSTSYVDYKYIDPNGYIVGKTNNGDGYLGLRDIDNEQHIYTDIFDQLKFRLYFSEQVNYWIRGMNNDGNWKDLNNPTLMSSGWSDISYDLSSVDNWNNAIYFKSVYILFDSYSGSFDGSEYGKIDYFLLLGKWSEDSQYKFSLLNQDNEEGMTFEFQQNVVTSLMYDFTINLYDSVSVVLTYSTSFVYDFYTDGWLYLEVEMDLDEKEASVNLRYENRTSIVRERTWYSLFGMSGIVYLLILEQGFPSLCINNSQISMGRSWVLIDYIDANYRLNQYWRIVGGVNVETASGTKTVDDEGEFTTESEFGVSMHKEAAAGAAITCYWSDIDCFDGISFNFNGEMINVDESVGDTDSAYYIFMLFNVAVNGSLIKVLEVEHILEYMEISYFNVYDSTDTLVAESTIQGTTNNQTMESSISVLRRDEKSIFFQSSVDHEDGSVENELNHNFEISGYDYTKEFVVYNLFGISNGVGVDTDDHVNLLISGYSVSRKDWLADTIGNILSGVIDLFAGVVAFFLMPVIAVLMFILEGMIKGFRWLAEALEPFFDELVDVFTSWLASILDDLGDLIEDIGMIAEWVGDYILSLLGDFIDGTISWLASISQDVIDVLAIIVFTFYDGFFVVVLGASEAPDFIAIVGSLIDPLVYVITGIPQFIIDVIGWVFVGGLFFILFYWMWALFFGFASERFDPLAGLAEFVERMTRGPDITFIGIGPFRFCVGWFGMLPLTMFLIVQPTNPFFWIW